MERINQVTAQLMQDGQEINEANIFTKSLATSGGTLTDTEEIKNHIKENVFYFNNNVVFIDTINNVLYFNGKSLKIKECTDFVHSFQKTQVKAIKGAQGLKAHFTENRTPRDTFYRQIDSIFTRISE